MKQKLPLVIRYICSVYAAGLLFFTIFRIVLLLTNTKAVHDIPDATGIMLEAFFMGFRFDTVISGYLLALPAVVLVFSELLHILSKRLLLVITVFIGIIYSLGFLICAADIPFFNNYNSRLNITILNWASSAGTVAKMILEDRVFLGYLSFYVALTALFVFILSRIYRRYAVLFIETREKMYAGKAFRFISSLVFFCFMFLGIRGRTDEKAPIMVGTAYFCNYDFANQAGLNPVFTLMKSWMEGMKDENKRLEFISDQEAIANVQHYLGIPVTPLSHQFPIFRTVNNEPVVQKYNVVFVLMESMSACYLQRFGNVQHLTPNLDSLAERGYSFDNFFSAGIHTYNGIFSSLYGYPALMARQMLKGAPVPTYTGLPDLMQQRGYETIFFMTHDDQFDNIGGFLTGNHFSRLISKKDYPSAEIKSTWGVTDHYMFRFALPVLNDYHRQNKPFMATFMTVSNHSPYVLPDNIPFKAAHTNVRGGCVEYADWSIGDFMSLAAKQPWFSNTIFVFTGDHGVNDGELYGDLPLTYSRVPFIIYMPGQQNQHKAITAPGGQIDIFPTLAGILGGTYTNNTMGIDLLHEKRPWMYFSQDDKLCVADSSQLYIWHSRGGVEDMYYRNGRQKLDPINRPKADSMKKYACSMLQTGQWLLNNKATGRVNQ